MTETQPNETQAPTDYTPPNPDETARANAETANAEKVAPDEATEVVGDTSGEDDNGVVELPNGDTLERDDNGNTVRVDNRTGSVYTANGDYHDLVRNLHALYPDKF